MHTINTVAFPLENDSWVEWSKQLDIPSHNDDDDGKDYDNNNNNNNVDDYDNDD